MSCAVLPSNASLIDACERLCAVEEELDLLRYSVDGWTAWPLIRTEVLLMLTGITFERRAVVSRFQQLRRAIQDVPQFARLRPARHVIQTYSSGLVERDGSCFSDGWFDDIVLSAGSTFKIETLNSPRFQALSERALIPRNISGAPILLAGAILRRIHRSQAIAQVGRELSAALHRPLNLPQVDADWVTRRLQRFSAMRTLYAALLRRVQPSYVLVIDAASHHGLVAAAKEQGATVLELQHGIADESHASYAWRESAARHRSRMPLPDRLLLYGSYWKDQLCRSGFWGDDLRVVGSPRIDRYRGSRKTGDDGRCHIVFTTQGLDRRAVNIFIGQFLEQLVDTMRFQLTIKLHPLYDSDKQSYLDAFRFYENRVEVLHADEGPSTFELLREAQVHVSVSSATHFDAIGLGVPTVILPFRNHEAVLPLQRAGHAWLARTPEELTRLVRAWRNLRVSAGTSAYYFQPAAQANILRELGLGTLTAQLSTA